MLILIPVDCNDIEEAQITLLKDVKKWALLDFSEGKVHKTTFFDTFEEINGNVSVDVDNMSNIILYGDYKIVDGKEFDNLKDEDFIVEKVVLIEKSR